MGTAQINHVRAGEGRTKFTGIWMVVVNERIFARSYSLSERSWYTTLLNGNAKFPSFMSLFEEVARILGD
jgi:hypothetical protein